MKKSMKKIIAFSAVAVSLVALSGAVYGKLKASVAGLPEDFTVTAHTGCEKTEDNSLESIVAGKNAAADTVEFDLRFDEEGRGVLSHDEGADNPVSLEDAISLIASYEALKANVDCKTTDNLGEVYRLAGQYGIIDRVFYTGIEEKDVQAVLEQTPEIPYYLNFSVDKLKKYKEEYIDDLINLVREKGAVGLNIHYTDCSSLMVRKFREQGLKISLWTANDIASMIVCLSFKPDNITTRYPSTLVELIDKLSK